MAMPLLLSVVESGHVMHWVPLFLHIQGQLDLPGWQGWAGSGGLIEASF